MPSSLVLDDDRLFPPEPSARAVSRRLYDAVRTLPIISPHGHCDPAWFSENHAFSNATDLLLAPDHYLFRMLYSQGVSLDALRVASRAGVPDVAPRAAWREFARHYHLFRGTPSAMWLNYVFSIVFCIAARLDETTADLYFDSIAEKLATEAFRPRSLFERFNIEFLATTDAPIDSLAHHRAIRDSGWKGQVTPTYRPDQLVDPEHEEFRKALEQLAALTDMDVFSWKGYLEAHRIRRSIFKTMGAKSTDHGHPTARTANLSGVEIDRLFGKVISGQFTPEDAELFRAQMLVEMARMSLDDGLVMQIHPGAFRNHNRWLFRTYGSDKGADIPQATDFVHALKPLLDLFGNESRLTVILFTLDETTYSRELAPLAGHYPILRLGPAWWIHDSPEGMRRFREQTTESAGFYNTVGFIDDTRAFLSIPARHDMARRIDCAFLARLVCEHRMDEDEARAVAVDLAYTLPKRAYNLDDAHYGRRSRPASDERS